MSENRSEYIIRIKGNDYPYFADKLEGDPKDKTGHIEFEHTQKNGTRKHVILAVSEIATIERNLPDAGQ